MDGISEQTSHPVTAKNLATTHRSYVSNSSKMEQLQWCSDVSGKYAVNKACLLVPTTSNSCIVVGVIWSKTPTCTKCTNPEFRI